MVSQVAKADKKLSLSEQLPAAGAEAPVIPELQSEITIKTADVEAAIEVFRLGLVTSKADAQKAAVMALEHCYIHRTAAQLRNMLAVIEKEGLDYVRRAPFTFYLKAFAPVKNVKKTRMEGEKEVKYSEIEFDKESLFVTKDGISELGTKMLGEAEDQLWWKMSKDKELGAFDAVRFDARILGLANKALKDIDESDEETSEAARNHVLGIKTQFEGYVAVNKATKAA